MMASIFDVQAPALDRLVAFSIAGVADPSAIENMTGVAQERPGGVPGWIAIYLRHGGRIAYPAKLPAVNWDARMGGDRNLANPLEHVVTGNGSSSGS